MNSVIENGVLSIYLEGRITADTSSTVETEINTILEQNPHTSLVFNCEKLDYLSSAGLRVVLRIKKAEPTLKIISVSPSVYEIFEMTGFTEMMTIEKAYKEISIDGCEQIGQGSNGKVYRINPETIVKVYFNKDALADIHRERELARKAFVMGIPTAISYDVVKVGDTYGSVFELLNAKSYIKMIQANPCTIDKYIELSVELLKKIHSTVVKEGELPDIKLTVLDWVNYLKDYLPNDTYEKLLKMVNEVPDTHTMIHGDYHMKNLMVQDGETLLIDMDTLANGHPIFELGSIYNAYVGFSELDHDVSMNFLGISNETSNYIWQKTLPLYLNTTDEARIHEVENKAKIIGYTRLLRRTIKREGFDKSADKITYYKDKLISLIDEVDTLIF
jgi:uncharacterized protein (TIGR02172 family)